MPVKDDLSPVLQAAKDILAAAKSEMHINDIATQAVSQHKNLGMSTEAFATKLTSALNAHLKTKKPIFVKPLNKQGRPRKGVYRLKQERSPLPIRPAPPPINTLFLGKAGEYAVASELMFWGFNVSLMAVDQGIDLVAEKNGKFRHIQVKTSTAASMDDPFSFQIQQKAFASNGELSPWYVFVMRKAKQTDFAVIPHSHLLNLRTLGVIGGQNLSIQIHAQDKGRRFLLNGRDDISLFINNFGII